MKANTAIGLMACALALALLFREKASDLRRYGVAALAMVPIGLGLATLFEHFSGKDLGFDQWLFRDVIAPGTQSPGRLAAVTALCFLMWGVAALAAALPGSPGWRLSLVAALASTVALAGALSLLGYFSGVWLGFAWWNYGGVAILTAAAFVGLGCGLAAWVRADGRLPWSIERTTTLGFAAGVVLMLVAAGSSDALTRRSLDSVDRITLSQQTLKEIQEARTSVLDLEEIASTYPTSSAEVAAHAALAQTTIRQKLREIRASTADSPSQLRRLDEIQGLLAEWIDWDPTVDAERGTRLTRDMRQLLSAAESEEDVRLRARQTNSALQIERTFLLTPLGLVISMALLFIGLASLNAGVLERARMQRVHQESEARLGSIVDSAMDAIISVNSAQRVVLFNGAAEKMFRCAAADAIGLPIDRFIPVRHRERHRQHVDRFGVTAVSARSMGALGELSGLRLDGEEFPIEASISQAKIEGEKLFTVILRDVTERRRAEEALRVSEEKYRILFEQNPHPMYVFDAETLAFLAVNDAAVRHYGFSADEFLAMTLLDIRAPEDVPLLLEALGETGVDQRGIFKHRKKDGTTVAMEVSGSRTTFLGRPAWLVHALDVTERENLEAQLIQAQKLESVGRLAGGVAHDFNNILGVILGSAELCVSSGDADPRLAKHLDNIIRAADRGAGLTRQLLAFSRRSVLQPRILALNEVVVEVQGMLGRLIGEDVELTTILDPHLPSIKADPGQLEQVLMNLIVNARDAMPSGGKLMVSTDSVDLDYKYTTTHIGVRPGRYVLLAVSDTGHGMSPEVQARLFEPFFTTKEKGKGTGLGLATVHGIVKQSGGHVTYYSEAGRGSTFKVYLPAVEDLPSGMPPVADERPGGTETVLVVEDEAVLRDTVQECLEGLGYAILTAPQGAAALALAESHPGPIQLLVTDVVMPGMGGRELARQLAILRPETKVLFVSGFTDDSILMHGVLEEGMPFLEKPFTTSALARKVRQVLDRT